MSRPNLGLLENVATCSSSAAAVVITVLIITVVVDVTLELCCRAVTINVEHTAIDASSVTVTALLCCLLQYRLQHVDVYT
jgi:hypothetical protein